MAEIRWTSEAEIWLKDIFDYIAQENLSAAINVVKEIYRKVQVLSQFPDMGYCFRSVGEGEIRILQYGHYRIAYLRRNNENSIDILGIFHGALDIDRYLQ